MTEYAEDPTDAELLAELGTLDEVSALIPTSQDHDLENVPQWCELVLELTRNTREPYIRQVLALRRHDGELIAQILADVLHPNGDRAAEQLWVALDEVMDRLMVKAKKVDVGLAQGLSLAIAQLRTPGRPDVERVKAQAVVRWEARQES
jgi:hypothetical protein